MTPVMAKSVAGKAAQAIGGAGIAGAGAGAVRSISVGTDMLSSVISLQKSRPWYNSPEEGSNLAVDNAVTLKELFADRTVAVFGVPAPFTGTCSLQHYPPYKKLASAMKGEAGGGCDEVVCYSVSDPYAHHNWSKSLNNDDSEITFLADPDASFALAYGVAAQYDEASLGQRSKRFSMVVVDGVVTNFRLVDDAPADAETLLGELMELKEHSSA